MDFDWSTALSVVDFIFANKIVLGGAIGAFIGWNLPQPKIAKYVQDKLVAGVKYVWSKFSKKEEL